MTDRVKIVLIIAIAAVISVGAIIYFSPYQSCVRAVSEGSIEGKPMPPAYAAWICSRK